MAKEYYRNSFFPSKLIANLPKAFSFNKGKKILMIDYATTDQLHVYKRVVNDAAIRGDNVGIDEYKEDYVINLLFDMSEIFQATDPLTGHIEAVMFIQFCFYQRAIDSRSATVHVFRSSGIDNVVYAELASLMGDFAQALDIGYTQVCVHVAFSLTDLYLELRKQGFVTVALFPEWVELAGVGVDDSALMVKQLGTGDRKLKSKEEILKAVNAQFTPEGVQSTYFTSGCVPAPILPITATTKQGFKFTFRNARRDEDEIMYKMFSDAADEGDGYAVNELPSLSFFRMIYLTGSIVIIMEDVATKAVAGVMIFLKSVQGRRATGSIVGTGVILKREYRSSGLNNLARAVGIVVQKSMGFKKEFSITFSTNHAAIKAARRFQLQTIGIFPNGAYQRGHGWVDLVYAVGSLDDEVGMLSKLGYEHLARSNNKQVVRSKL